MYTFKSCMLVPTKSRLSGRISFDSGAKGRKACLGSRYYMHMLFKLIHDERVSIGADNHDDHI